MSKQYYVMNGTEKISVKKDGFGWKYYHKINREWYYYCWTMYGNPVEV